VHVELMHARKYRIAKKRVDVRHSFLCLSE
jgi:hypothetical protein